MEWYEAELRKLEDRMCLATSGSGCRTSEWRTLGSSRWQLRAWTTTSGCTSKRQVSGRLRRQLCAKQRTLGTSQTASATAFAAGATGRFEQQPTAATSPATASGLKLLCHHARLSDVTNSEADDLVLAALQRSTLAAAGQVVALGQLGRGGPGPVTKAELAACKEACDGLQRRCYLEKGNLTKCRKVFNEMLTPALKMLAPPAHVAAQRAAARSSTRRLCAAVGQFSEMQIAVSTTAEFSSRIALDLERLRTAAEMQLNRQCSVYILTGGDGN